MSTPDKGQGSGQKKVELSANESWLLSNAMLHHKTGIATADINWAGVLAEDGCPYGTEGSIRVTFNKLRVKLGLGSGNAKAAGGAAADGMSGPAAARTPTPRTPRKKKEDGVGSSAKKTPSKVTKAPRSRKSSVNKEALAAALTDNDAVVDTEETATDAVSDGGDMSAPKGQKGAADGSGENVVEDPVEDPFGPVAVQNYMSHPGV